MRVMLTRPEADAKSLADALAAKGMEVVSAPLLHIHVHDGDALDLAGVQAVLLTSANGVRAFCARSANRDLPALCVGDATAREARASGFAIVESAAGDVTALADLVRQTRQPDEGALLHAAGTRVAGDLKGLVEAAGFTYRRAVLYAAKTETTLPAPAREALASGSIDWVLLFSPRTAQQFAALVADAGLVEALGKVRCAGLSAAVAEKVSALPWAGVCIAQEPTQDALLACLD